ncbi:MAG TPA: hypothetical protein VEJ22_02870, partial [Nitrospirota bacterium]|nr:hypothetical protein [Nitrospirota bacterium]
RTHLASRAIGLCYSRLLLKDLREDHGLPHLASEELQVEAIWQEAVAQHYASGSSYLDVTHSVECAAWFALHVGKFVSESSMSDPTRPAWASEAKHGIKWLEYSPAVEPGYIYAFDVEKWDPSGLVPPDLADLPVGKLDPRDPASLLPDLALVDLFNAPEPFKTPRMLAQLGCLIRTGESQHHDLKCRCVKGTPLRISWPMKGSEVVNRTVEEMFPEPAVDPWYQRFLMVPMMLDVDAATRKLVLRRPLPVTLYRGETEAYNAKLIGTEWVLNPPLLHDFLLHLPVRPNAPKDEIERCSLMSRAMSTTTPIVLEAPVLALFPPPNSSLWNHELLLSDLCGSVATYSRAMKKARDVSIVNVLFQFSQLEEVFWERVRTSNQRLRLTRGLWLSGSQKEWLLAVLMVQDFPGTELEIRRPVKIRLDPAKRRFTYERFNGDTEWAELSTMPELALPVFVALYLLRALNPRLKAEAVPNNWGMPLEQHGGASNNTYWFSIFADAARLIRVKGNKGVADWFFLRNNKQNDPFTTVADAGSPSFSIETTAAFADLTASSFHDALAAARSSFEQT